MESWRIVLRDGLFKVLNCEHLAVLHQAMLTDDPRWIQGTTTIPPPLTCMQDFPVEAADAIGICGWIGDGFRTVGEVEEFFAKKCYEMDQILGEPAACRWWLNWHDDAPRETVRTELLAEIELELSRRAAGVAA